MAKERKKRQERKLTVDTSKLKSYGSDFKSRGEQRLAFSKRVKEEADKVQQQIFEEQEKAQKKSLWSSVGGALGGLALGLATGGLGWVAAGVGTGLGTYGGAQAGKAIAEKELGKRKTIKSDMFYESEAKKQNLAFQEFDEKLNESILNRSLAAGVMAAAFTGGGDLIKSLKEKKNLKDAAVTAQQVETGAKVKKAAEGADFVMGKNISGPQTFVDRDLSAIDLVKDLQESRPDLNLSNIQIVATESLGTQAATSLRQPSSMTSSFANSLTPITEQAAPSIMDSYFKGLAEQKSKSMQQGLMFAGASSLYGYRPELQSLRQIQFGNKIKPYG